MIKRREFLEKAGALLTLIFSGCIEKGEKAGLIEERNISIREAKPMTIKSKVYVIKTNSRENGIKELLKYFDTGSLLDKRVALKANYNSSDLFPASTHIDTLRALIDSLKEKGANLVLAERSGMGDTKRVLVETGVWELAKQKELEVEFSKDCREILNQVGTSFILYQPTLCITELYNAIGKTKGEPSAKKALKEFYKMVYHLVPVSSVKG